MDNRLKPLWVGALMLASVSLFAQPTTDSKDIQVARQQLRIGTDTARYFTAILQTISAAATHHHSPTGKAVYDYCQSFLTLSTTFSGDVSGVYNNLQLGAGVVGSTEVTDNSLTATDLSVNVVSSVDGVTNDGGDIDLIAGSGVSITPNDAANTITITNTGDTNAADDLTTSTNFAGDVSGVYNNLQLGTGVVGSTEVTDNSLTSGDLAVNVVSSVDGVTNDGGDIDLIAGSGVSITPNDAANTITITNTGDTNAADDLTTTTNFSGDVSGVYNNLQLGTGVVGSTEIADGSIQSGDIALPSGKINVGNGSGIATAVTPSGDATMTNLGVITVTKASGEFLTPAEVQFTPSANMNDAAIGANVSQIIISPTANISLTGMANGVDGRQVYIFNQSLFFSVAIPSQSGSSASNQFKNPFSNTITLKPYSGAVAQYLGFDNRWHIVGTTGSMEDYPYTRDTVTQASHGFSGINAAKPVIPVYIGWDGKYRAASASGTLGTASDSTLATALITYVATTNVFLVQPLGTIIRGTHSLTGKAYYLDNTAGTYSTTGGDKKQLLFYTQGTQRLMSVGQGVITAGGSSGHTIRDDGTDKTARAALNFVSTSTINTLATDDAGNNETEIALNIPTDGVTATEIAAGAVGASEIASTAVTAGSYTYGNFTVDADGRLTAASSGTNPVTGSGTTNYVAYFNGTQTLTGGSNFQFNGSKVTIGGVSAGNPIVDIVTGIGDGTINETNCFRLRHTTTNGNTFVMQMGVSNVGAGGSNQGYGYIQTGLWGGSADNPFFFNPKGGKVGVAFDGSTSRATWPLTVSGDIASRAITNAGNTEMGRLVFGHQGNYGNSPCYIAGIYDKVNWYQGTGLIFNTVSGADISGSLGVERVRISSDGLVGIGINAPISKLQVKGDGTTSGTYGLIVTNSSGTTSTASLAVRDDGRVGIGTNSMASRLQILGAGTTGSTYPLIVTNSSGTTSTAALVVRDDSRVGIGTNGPSSKLQVTGDGSTSSTYSLIVTDASGTTGTAPLAIRDDNRVGIGMNAPTARAQILGTGNTSSTYSLLVTNSTGTTATAAIAVRDDSRVGIGTNAPTSSLSVVGTGTTSSTYPLIVTNSTGTTATAVLTARDDGKVGIGTNAPAEVLDIIGQARADAYDIRDWTVTENTNAGELHYTDPAGGVDAEYLSFGSGERRYPVFPFMVQLEAIDYNTTWVTGRTRSFFTVPARYNGWKISKVYLSVSSVGTGTNTIAIEKGGVSQATQNITAATHAITLDGAIATDDVWTFNITAISGTPPKGLRIEVELRNK